MSAERLPTRRRSVKDWSTIDWRSVGDWLAIVSATHVYDHRKVYDCLKTSRQPIGDQSATKNCDGIATTAATNRRPVPDILATTKTFLRSIWSQRGFTCSKQNLLATKSSLPHSCDISNLSWPVGDLFATSLRPPEIMVARRSPPGYKLCVTRALVKGSPRLPPIILMGQHVTTHSGILEARPRLYLLMLRCCVASMGTMKLPIFLCRWIKISKFQIILMM